MIVKAEGSMGTRVLLNKSFMVKLWIIIVQMHLITIPSYTNLMLFESPKRERR
jgi:hypothetical protein